MNNGESKFWRNQLREPLKAMGHVCRVESHATATGMPDVNLQLQDGPEWWIELKFCDDDKKGVVMRPAQKRWHRQRARAGGRSCVLVRHETGGSVYIYLLPGILAAGLPVDPESWRKCARKIWTGGAIWNVELEEILRAETAKWW